MTMFDRRVDLARFTDSTPLYVMCRDWMRNKPQRRQQSSGVFGKKVCMLSSGTTTHTTLSSLSLSLPPPLSLCLSVCSLSLSLSLSVSPPHPHPPSHRSMMINMSSPHLGKLCLNYKSCVRHTCIYMYIKSCKSALRVC